jgi:hydroxypyruvate isomerase
MTRLAVNIGFLFRERPWIERIAAAAEAGFEAIEFAWPPVSPDDVIRAVRLAGVRVALLNMPAGDLDAGERGYPNDPSRREAWRDDLDRALELAAEAGCPLVNVLAGNRVAGLPISAQVECLEDQLAWALGRAESAGVGLVVELLNPVELPDYLVAGLEAWDRLANRFAASGLRLQADTWHLAHVTTDVATTLAELGAAIGHVQIADRPGRGAPGTGDLDWPRILATLDDVGYRGAVGLEYVAPVGTAAALGWLAEEQRRWSAAPYRSLAG